MPKRWLFLRRMVVGAGLMAVMMLTSGALWAQSPAVVGKPADIASITEQASTGSIQPLTELKKIRAVDLTAPADDVWQRLRHGFAIPNLDSSIVADKQAQYVARPQTLKVMFERSGLYLYHIIEQCERRGLPSELALLPFIESAFNPYALSPARASGLWQFIPSTGKSYGLKQDGTRDERRDIIASTDAALNYLTTLYDMYGDWYLALAAYNWGEGSVARAIDRNRSQGLPTDYQSLSMPDETRQYVPRLQAIKNIIQTPYAFNVSLPMIENQPYFTKVVKSRGLDIKTAAKMADMTVEEFRALNPSFNKPQTKGVEDVTILVPNSKVDLFVSNMEREYRYAEPGGWRFAEDINLQGLTGAGSRGLRAGAQQEILAQLGGDGVTAWDENLGLSSNYRDPYMFAQQATKISQANPLAQVKRYAAEEPGFYRSFRTASKPVSRASHSQVVSKGKNPKEAKPAGKNVGKPSAQRGSAAKSPSKKK